MSLDTDLQDMTFVRGKDLQKTAKGTPEEGAEDQGAKAGVGAGKKQRERRFCGDLICGDSAMF